MVNISQYVEGACVRRAAPTVRTVYVNATNEIRENDFSNLQIASIVYSTVGAHCLQQNAKLKEENVVKRTRFR